MDQTKNSTKQLLSNVEISENIAKIKDSPQKIYAHLKLKQVHVRELNREENHLDHEDWQCKVAFHLRTEHRQR